MNAPISSLAPALAARSVALDLLRAALERRDGLAMAMESAGFRRLHPRDRAFARALVMTTLRHLGAIDRALDSRLRSPPPERVRDLLRLGFGQVFWLAVPDFAAVDTTVALAPPAFRGLINAVLRGQIREGPPPATAALLAPPWLYARWRVAHGAAGADAIANSIADEPLTDVTARDPADVGLAEAVGGEWLDGGGVRVAQRGEVTSWPGFAEGRWWVQDAAAAVAARLLGARRGVTALDLCAAPGGKTLQLAAAGARVTAVDRSSPRLRQLAANLARTRLTAETIAADATGWADDRLFDRVLLDAPCSGTGTFRRHPDVLWNARAGEIAELVRAQAALLRAAAARVAPGGRLVYSVCSLEPEEGEDQILPFLRGVSGFVLEPVLAGEGGSPTASLADAGWLRILPHHRAGGLDGFFIARLRRGS